MLKIENMPKLPGQEVLPVTQVTDDALSSITIQGGFFTPRPGDLIKFLDEKPIVIAQPIWLGPNAPIAHHVAVEKNGELSWLSVATLVKKDAFGVPVDELRLELSKFKTLAKICKHLRGKTIRCTGTLTYDAPVYENGKRVAGTTVQRTTGALEYA